MVCRTAVLALGALAASFGVATTLAASEWQDLFDGRTLEGWRQLNGTATYEVVDGAIVGTTAPGSPNSFLATTREFGDFVLELEFKVDPRLNSGVQIRSESRPSFKNGRVYGYQVEIDPSPDPYSKQPANLDAAGAPVAPGAAPRSWTGGIYDEQRRGWLQDLTDRPAAREAFRPGQWNHLRIEAIGPWIRTWVNGVAAADTVDGLTRRGFIALQVHAVKQEDPLQVKWRNLRIRELNTSIAPADRSTPPAMFGEPAPADAIDLLAGGTADAWRSQDGRNWLQADGPADWLLRNGVLESIPGVGSIITHHSFGDLFLHLELRVLDEPTNSGVYLMSRYEIGVSHRPGGTGGWGNLADAPAPRRELKVPLRQWQSLDVLFQAPRLDDDGRMTEPALASVWHNGVLIHDQVRLGNRKGAARRLADAVAGPLMLQEHGAAVQFRNICVRPGAAFGTASRP